jgi:AraC-like DNA-binding protein
LDLQRKPLNAYPAFRASSSDELAAAVAAQLAATFVALPNDRRTIDACGNRFPLPQSSLWFCSYGLPVALKFPEADHVRVQFHHAGVGATWVGSELVAVTPQQACISSGAAEFDFAADFQQLVWRVPKDALVQKLAGLTGGPVVSDLEFDCTLDLTTPECTTLTQILACVVHAAETIAGDAAAIVLTELEQALIASFLSASRHSCREALDRRAPGAAPWQVRRAESYIEAHWDQPVTIEDLSAVTGASARTLFRTFKQSRGYSPLDFARRVRLEKARGMLAEPGPATTVTAVAFACGFGDLGRFSKDFCQAFGELPSALLNRTKGAGPALH